MIMVGDYAAKLLHEERSARWQAEASEFRRARAFTRRGQRSNPTPVTTEPVRAARVPRQRRERAPASRNEPTGLRRPERESSAGRRAA